MKLVKLWLCAVVVFVSMLANGQVSTGKPPLGSFSSGPDVINLGNLNVHLEFPVIHKPGRGMPFDYVLSTDTSVWTPVASAWQPTGNWGWRALTEANIGYISFTQTTVRCQIPDSFPPRFVNDPFRDNYQYHDQFGTIHYFANTWGGCPGDITDDVSTSTDSSGLTLSTVGAPAITDKAGTVSHPPVNNGTGAGTRTDRNGNQITTTGNTFTDTLGATVLSVSGTNPVVFAYKDTLGNSQSVTVNYTQKTVQTNFGCSGIAEFPATLANLVSSITYPDGSSFSFTYEPTPGVPANVTGRLKSVTLRTGGSISYTYQGSNNGIICSDGSAAGLLRTLSDGSTTSYSRVNSSGSWVTTVSDGASPANQQVIYFTASGAPIANFYETHRDVFTGPSTGTPLFTIDTCYNAAVLPCTGTAVALPIGEIKRYTTTISNGLVALTDTVLGSFGLPTRVDEYDYGTAPHGPFYRRTLTSYAPLGNGIVGMPSQITVQDRALIR